MTDNIKEDITENMMGKILMESIDKEARDNLISRAISYLIDEGRGGKFGTNKIPSKLQDAFNAGMVKFAQIQVEEMVENSPDIKEKIRETIQKGMQKFLDEKSEELVKHIHETLCQSWSRY